MEDKDKLNDGLDFNSNAENPSSFDSSMFSSDMTDGIEDDLDFLSDKKEDNQEFQQTQDEQNINPPQEDINSSLDEIIQENKEVPKEEIEEEITETQDEQIPDETKENIEENVSLSDRAEEIQKPNVIVEDIDEGQNSSENHELITVRPVKFQQFEDTPPVRSIKRNLDIMQDISMHISVELGRTKLSIKEVMEMKKGSIVELDKIAGEQVEIYVNEKLVAKGEVIVIEDKFGVRVTMTNMPKTIG